MNDGKRVDGYSRSDKLAIALACSAGALTIILFLAVKTRPFVLILLMLVAALLAYPILHFVPRAIPRTITFLSAVLLITGLGWMVWPTSQPSPNERRVSAASASSPAEANSPPRPIAHITPPTTLRSSPRKAKDHNRSTLTVQTASGNSNVQVGGSVTAAPCGSIQTGNNNSSTVNCVQQQPPGKINSVIENSGTITRPVISGAEVTAPADGRGTVINNLPGEVEQPEIDHPDVKSESPTPPPTGIALLGNGRGHNFARLSISNNLLCNNDIVLRNQGTMSDVTIKDNFTYDCDWQPVLQYLAMHRRNIEAVLDYWTSIQEQAWVNLPDDERRANRLELTAIKNTLLAAKATDFQFHLALQELLTRPPHFPVITNPVQLFYPPVATGPTPLAAR